MTFKDFGKMHTTPCFCGVTRKQWEALITLNQGTIEYVIHATIMMTGKVLMFNSSSGDYPESVVLESANQAADTQMI